MMDTLIDFGRGPLFRFAVALALLGLARYVLLSAWGFREARRRAGDRRLALGQVVARTFVALNPARYLTRNRGFLTVLSVLFHVGVILVPIFFSGHVRLWRRGLGFGWPALPLAAADALTWLTVATGVLLVAARAWSSSSRSMSRVQDWLLTPLITLAFLSGYLLAHPGSNPLALKPVTLVHVAAGDLLLILTPFTKIAHCVLLPFSQLVNEMAWRFVPGAGHEVTRTLGKEGQPI
jgi:nitrate reductase gamma subunit